MAASRVLALLAVTSLAGTTACGSSATKPAATQPTAATASSARPLPASSSTTTPPRPNPVAADQYAQDALTAALSAAKQIYDRTYDYSQVTPTGLAPLAPAMHFGPIEQASSLVVGVLAQDRNDVVLVLQSRTGRWYCIAENVMDGTLYGEGPTRNSVDSNGQCRQPGWPPPGKSQLLF